MMAQNVMAVYGVRYPGCPYALFPSRRMKYGYNMRSNSQAENGGNRTENRILLVGMCRCRPGSRCSGKMQCSAGRCDQVQCGCGVQGVQGTADTPVTPSAAIFHFYFLFRRRRQMVRVRRSVSSRSAAMPAIAFHIIAVRLPLAAAPAVIVK